MSYIDSSTLLKHLNERTPRYKRNPKLDELLSELSELFGPLEAKIEERFTEPQLPVLLLLGNPRSGTSIFMQFLAMTGKFTIVTNFLSRFSYAPYIGAKLQQLLTDPEFDFHGQLTGTTETLNLSSDLGKTTGMLNASEFLFFFRRFIPFYDPGYMDDEQLKKIDIEGIHKGIAAIEVVFNKPFAVKSVFFQYNLDVLSRIFPNSLMIYLQRDPLFVMQSLLIAREDFYGNRDYWFSVRPKEYEKLKNMNVYHQIAGQVFFTEKALIDQLKDIPEIHQLKIAYEDFCPQPEKTYKILCKKLSLLGYEITGEYLGPGRFTASNNIRLGEIDIQKLKDAYNFFTLNK